MKSDSPLVSIIVPTFNYGSFLNESLLSVKLQTYSNWECIVVDDGSTDSTKSFVESLMDEDKRFVYIFQNQLGVSSARNTGLKYAKGKFIQFLDADDLLDADKLRRNIAHFVENPRTDLVYSDEMEFHVNQNNEILHDKSTRREITIPMEYIERVEKVLAATIFGMDNPLIRRGIVDKVVGFDTDIDTGQDWLFWFKVVLTGAKFEKIDGALVRIRVHNINKKRRNYVRSQRLIRSRIALQLTQDRLLYLNNKYKYWFITKEARRLGDDLIAVWYGMMYFIFAFPKTMSDFKIFIGDILFPRTTAWLKKMASYKN